MSKKLLIVVSVIVGFLILLYFAAGIINKPYKTRENVIELSKYQYSETGFECSRPIKIKFKQTFSLLGKELYTGYEPLDFSEAKLFCHSTYVIEYKGKLEVLKRPEVLNLITKYEYKDVTIKALEFAYIQDKEFVHRLLPQYKSREIGCIIILETPNEKMVFLEDEHLETFEQIDYKLFDQQLAKVSPEDKQLFLENLQ